MGTKNNNTFIKKKKDEQRLKKRKEKEQKKIERKENSTGGEFDSMIAYVDKFGNLSSEAPEDFGKPQKLIKKVGKDPLSSNK
jgi:S-adenosylmethionine hydrolase